MNPCIKTGANVWLESHGAAIHGDLYAVNGVILLRYLPHSQYMRDDLTADDCDMVFLDRQAERNAMLHPDCVTDFLNLESAGVIIVAERAAFMSDEFAQSMSTYLNTDEGENDVH